MYSERKIFTTRSSMGGSVELIRFSSGGAHIDCFEELEYLLGKSPELIRKMGKPVRNGDNIDWYSEVMDTKLLSDFDERKQLSIDNRIRSSIKKAMESCIHSKGREILESLLQDNIALSNGSEDVLIWGYTHHNSRRETGRLDEIRTNLEELKTEVHQRRDEHGGTTGKLTISLIWNTDDDLDLHVIEPSGEKIHYSKKQSSSGGRLDIDANESAIMDNPVENIFWENPPPGQYRVIVNCYNRRSSEGNVGIPFELLISDEVNNDIQAYKNSINSTNLFEEIPLKIEI